MALKLLTNKQGVKISYEKFVDLTSKNLINLGIQNDLATQLAGNSNIVPTKTTAVKAFHFWNWVAVLCFLVSIYYTFTAHWWSFIGGFFVMRFVWNANKKGNAANFVNAALEDKEFYEKVMEIDGWIYQFDEGHVDEIIPCISAKFSE